MVKVFKDKQDLSIAAAELFIKAAKEAIKISGHFVVALTGGSSPQIMYKLLAEVPYRNEVEWEKVVIYWGDERWVPLHDAKSNAGMAFDLLLNHVPIPESQVFPMYDGKMKPEDFARQYERLLKKYLSPGKGFDLILLGLGDDGHTASLFPGTEVIKEKSNWVTAYYLQSQEMYRITLTAPVINLSKNILFMVFGSNKSQALYEVLEGETNYEKYPAQLIQPAQGEITWLVDEAAAQKIK